MMDGWRKEDPATTKMLPVEADVPESIATLGQQPGATELMRAVGDLALIAFYFLLRVGEYTTKATRNNSKQTEEFEMEDITFFEHNALNQKRQLSRKAADSSIMNACAATLRLKNQKNGWKNVCIHQDTNGILTLPSSLSASALTPRKYLATYTLGTVDGYPKTNG